MPMLQYIIVYFTTSSCCELLIADMTGETKAAAKPKKAPKQSSVVTKKIGGDKNGGKRKIRVTRRVSG